MGEDDCRMIPESPEKLPFHRVDQTVHVPLFEKSFVTKRAVKCGDGKKAV